METKTLKIEIPKGYEIDREKSTFENIVFKKVVIRWNKYRDSVEIKTDDEHFILDSNPSYFMDWNDAMRFYDNLQFWKLPTVEQLKIIHKYFNEINKVIEENGGFRLLKGFYWSIIETSESGAWCIDISNSCSFNLDKKDHNYVRAVVTL